MISTRFRWYQLLKKIFSPYLGLFRPKFGPKFGIWLEARHRLIQFVWYHTFWFHSMVFELLLLVLFETDPPKRYFWRQKFVQKFGFQPISGHFLVFLFSYLSFPCYSLKSVGPIQISLVQSCFIRSKFMWIISPLKKS